MLVADADAKARGITVQTLLRKGYQVEEAASGPEALRRVEQGRCDVIVLEMALPGVGGAEVMRRTRQLQRDLPIIVLTSQPSLEGAIAAVRANVVDYLVKPCRSEDLICTVARALEERARQARQQRLLEMVSEVMGALRQTETSDDPPPTAYASGVSVPNLIEVGALALDRGKRLVTVKTSPPRIVELTEGEVSILVALMEKPNQVFTCHQLAKIALGYDGMDKWTVESVVRSSVFRLRNKIEPGPDAPRLIRTVRGRGYFLSPAA